MTPGLAAAQADQAAPNVTGRVIDAFSMGPLAGARVTAGTESAVADRDGRFALTLPRGPARLVVTANGHLTEQVAIVVVEQTVILEIQLRIL